MNGTRMDLLTVSSSPILEVKVEVGASRGGISHPIRRAVTCSRQLPQEGAPKGPVSLLPAVGTSATPTEGDNVGKFCLMSCETTNTAKHQFLSQHLQSDNHQTPNKV